jgi:hypothetical protein
LQSRSSFLDEEHKKLLQTISTTDEVVKSSYYHTTADGPALTTSSDFLADAPGSFALEEDHSVFVRGVNYRNIFKQCSIALAVASIDGRFMDCNTEFEVLTGYERDELLSSEKEEATEITADPVLSQDGVPSTVTTSRRRNLSLFNLLGREDMEQVFRAMSCMLKRPVDLKKREVGNQTNRATDGIGSRNQNFDCWSGYVTQTRLVEDKVNILTLVAGFEFVKTFTFRNSTLFSTVCSGDHECVSSSQSSRSSQILSVCAYLGARSSLGSFNGSNTFREGSRSWPRFCSVCVVVSHWWCLSRLGVGSSSSNIKMLADNNLVELDYCLHLSC